jgi:hypothetical protein
MPFLVATLVGFIAQALASVAVRILVGLGLGYIAYKGADTLLSLVQADITAKLGALGGGIAQALTIANVPQALVVLFGYYATRVAAQAASKLTFGKKAP